MKARRERSQVAHVKDKERHVLDDSIDDIPDDQDECRRIGAVLKDQKKVMPVHF